MMSWKFKILEVIKEETETERGEAIVRTIGYDTRAEAERKLATMKPIENGKLIIVEEFY